MRESETDYMCRLCNADVVIIDGRYECECLRADLDAVDFPRQWIPIDYGTESVEGLNRTIGTKQ